MQQLYAITEDLVFGEITTFSADEASAQTILSVTNASGFAADDYVMLGPLGHETSEIKQVSTVSSDLTTITLTSATKFAHAKNAVITSMLYNQRKFYNSTSKAGTYTHLSAEGSPVSIEVDSPLGTRFEDTSGSSTSWYKSTYYNSTLATETNPADAAAIKAGETDHYTSIHKVMMEAGMSENYYIPIEIVDDYRLEAENQADSAVSNIYSLPFSAKPPLFEQIVRLLSAGLLLSKEFGLEADLDVSKTGERKIQRAEELLEKIRDGKLTLRDKDGAELSKTTRQDASCSNVYNSTDKGELFNISDEDFRMTNPSYPTS